MNTQAQKLPAFFLFALLYLVALFLNKYLFAAWVYDGGVSLFYLPAGVKLMAIMVGGWPALLGVCFVAVFHTLTFWPDSWLFALLFIAVWGGAPYACYQLCRRLLGIGADLSGVTGGRILVIGLALSYTTAAATQLTLFLAGKVDGALSLAKLAAMGFGDFAGIAACLGFAWLFRGYIRTQATKAVK
jgi:hypothetical protein